ncbi:hypothetical protein TrRE_jg13118 [Triparma retinervis]|uniref:Phospholipid scramblase n=1 Tax=Triparma retinervis TaxID=2557542 RepID=A0A9W7FWN0_9STRA|nr:hypothetical protein TrRE_jg13118 [Triparma retinervis]
MVKNAQVMERNLEVCSKMQIVQTRRGWFQECCGCEARSEFKYYNEDNVHFATSLDDSSCLCRICCQPSYPFKATVVEEGTTEEIMTVTRPFKCAVSACKCCCYQEVSISTPSSPHLGRVVERCWYCVPRFVVLDGRGREVYKLHQPTCCGGACVDCCKEGNPCGKGCCKVPFGVYDAGQEDTDGRDAVGAGKILRKPRSLASELFTDADVFDVDMPEGSTSEEKALLVGATLFLNANFFEGGE